MSGPDRLLDGPLEGLAGDLLRAGVDERAPERTKARTLAALGVSNTIAVLSTATAAAAGAPASSLVVTAAGQVTVAAVLKWLAIGAAAGLLTATAGDRVFHSTPANVNQPSVVSPEKEQKVEGVRAAEHARVEPSSESTRSTGDSAPATSSARFAEGSRLIRSGSKQRALTASTQSAVGSDAPSVSRLRASSDAMSAAPELAREVALIDQARTLVRSGDSAGAMGLLARHQSEFPHGALTLEALVLRVDALMRSGDREAALRIGRPVLSAAPTSPQAGRIRRILGIQPGVP